jgi:hypothetical protein
MAQRALFSYALIEILGWRTVLFVFVVDVAIWLWVAFSLLARWNLGRIISILWCILTIVWSSYGLGVSGAWHQPQKLTVYVATVLINGAIAA